jgi:hypothetical protein
MGALYISDVLKVHNTVFNLNDLLSQNKEIMIERR